MVIEFPKSNPSRPLNYFAHAIRFLDRPLFMAGLAVPDWLSVVDRRARVRSRTIRKHWETLQGDETEIAAGILQHLEDDQWFHATPAFYGVTGRIGATVREHLKNSHDAGDDAAVEDVWPFGFLGHLLAEMLIDAALAAEFPDRLGVYYDQLACIDDARVAAVVERLAERPVANLAHFIDLYRRERFLFDYAQDDSLLRRINQVLRRVGLPVLPGSTTRALAEARQLVMEELPGLLPAERFGHNVRG